MKELMQYFGIQNLKNQILRTLSVGQRERVNIVRAFVHMPKIVILDEPGSNLDEALFEKTFLFLKSQAEDKKITLCIATHTQQYSTIATKNISLYDA